MSLFDADDVKVEAAIPTWTEKTQQLIAKQQLQDYQTYFKGTETKYVGQAGDPASGLAAKNYADWSKQTVAADAAQAVAKAGKQAGPMLANTGTFANRAGQEGSTLGASYAGGMADAEVSGETDINARMLGALSAGMGLGGDVSRSAQQSAGQAAQRGISIAQAELDNNISGMQGKSKMISDGLGAI